MARSKVFLLAVAGLFSSLSFAEVKSVYIESRLDPNAIIITEVDIVFLYDDALVETFPDNKSSWYGNRRQLTQQWGEQMDVVSVFVPQGFDSETASLPERRGQALRVYIFGQHDASTKAPADVTASENVTVYIDEFGIIVNQ